MTRVISIVAALVFLVGILFAAGAWWQLSSDNADLASQLAALRRANASKLERLEDTIAAREAAIRTQKRDFALRLSALAKRDSELNAYLKQLLAEAGGTEAAAAEREGATDEEPRSLSDLDPAPEPIRVAEMEPGELIDPAELVLVPEDDHNQDGLIDAADVEIVMGMAGRLTGRPSQEGDEDFNPAADLDGDGAISLSDSVGLARLLRDARIEAAAAQSE